MTSPDRPKGIDGAEFKSKTGAEGSPVEDTGLPTMRFEIPQIEFPNKENLEQNKGIFGEAFDIEAYLSRFGELRDQAGGTDDHALGREGDRIHPEDVLGAKRFQDREEMNLIPHGDGLEYPNQAFKDIVQERLFRTIRSLGVLGLDMTQADIWRLEERIAAGVSGRQYDPIFPQIRDVSDYPTPDYRMINPIKHSINMPRNPGLEEIRFDGGDVNTWRDFGREQGDFEKSPEPAKPWERASDGFGVSSISGNEFNTKGIQGPPNNFEFFEDPRIPRDPWDEIRGDKAALEGHSDPWAQKRDVSALQGGIPDPGSVNPEFDMGNYIPTELDIEAMRAVFGNSPDCSDDRVGIEDPVWKAMQNARKTREAGRIDWDQMTHDLGSRGLDLKQLLPISGLQKPEVPIRPPIKQIKPNDTLGEFKNKKFSE